MDAEGTILQNGNVLIRNGKIVATWKGAKVPAGIDVRKAVAIELGPNALIFPGLINLHNHPTYNFLNLWPAPSSHTQPTAGRPLGTEPYSYRYQWRLAPEHTRLIKNPQTLLASGAGLNLYPEVIKYAEIKALLGGETAFQGAPADLRNNILIRNVGDPNFGRDRIESHVPSIRALIGDDLDSLKGRMRNGEVDAWIAHLGEGVRDSQRRAGDFYSSRTEFTALISKGLLTDNTVLVHANSLEPSDFASMRNAQSIRSDGTGDGLGAKLVWSPLSNMLLYGQTTLIYPALSAGLTVSLGTDWSPSGSRNLLGELKIADIILRGSQHVGDRNLIPKLRITGHPRQRVYQVETDLDKLLVKMVTTNPAKTLRWNKVVGSIEAGKFADLLVITKSGRPSTTLPDSPYRNLIDATEEDVNLVLVNGEPLVGDIRLMSALKPNDFEIIKSKSGCFQKAIDVTKPTVEKGYQTLADIEQTLRNALTALGGDNPPPNGGPADDSNTYSYLKARIDDKNDKTDAEFREMLVNGKDFELGLDSQNRLNLEAIQLSPILVEDDDFYFHLLEGDVFPLSGLIADTTPPFRLYRANFNHINGLRNPFAAISRRQKHYEVARGTSQPCQQPLFQ